MVRLVVERMPLIYHETTKCTTTVNFCYLPEPSTVKRELSEVEKEGLRRGNGFVEKGRAYALEHGTRPSTIGFVLASNPLALLAWYVQNRFEII